MADRDILKPEYPVVDVLRRCHHEIPLALDQPKSDGPLSA